jgi:hypothetical protein
MRFISRTLNYYSEQNTHVSHHSFRNSMTILPPRFESSTASFTFSNSYILLTTCTGSPAISFNISSASFTLAYNEPISILSHGKIPFILRSLKIKSKELTFHPLTGYTSDLMRNIDTTETVIIIPCLRVI